MLVDLCRPLVETTSTLGGRPQILTPETSQGEQDTNPCIPPVWDPSLEHDDSAELGSIYNDAGLSSWNDDMMWQLFQSQPSLDWFNADTWTSQG